MNNVVAINENQPGGRIMNFAGFFNAFAGISSAFGGFLSRLIFLMALFGSASVAAKSLPVIDRIWSCGRQPAENCSGAVHLAGLLVLSTR